MWTAGFNYPDPVALPLVFAPVPEPKTVRNRVRLDLASASEHQQAEVRRLMALGAAQPTSARATCAGWCSPTRKETSSACLSPVYAGTGPVAAVEAGSADPATQARFWGARPRAGR